MKIVIAPDSFKGSLSSIAAAQAIERGLRSVAPSIATVTVPLADGGEGTVDAVLHGLPGEKVLVTVNDPFDRSVIAAYAWYSSQSLAVIEMAQASGLPLLADSELNPALASTFGTGQLIVDALNRNAKTIVLGLGGSATVDGGMGCLQALGIKFYDHAGIIERYRGPLGSIESYSLDNMHPRLSEVTIVLASDVTNPLLGDKGAIEIFGPQKGVKPNDIAAFEQGMSHWAQLLAGDSWRQHAQKSGAGAAGGIGFALGFFASCRQKSGFDVVAEFIDLKKRLFGADLLITGEGSMDSQSFFGKVPTAAANLAGKDHIPTVALAGRIDGPLKDFSNAGIILTVPIVDGVMSISDAMGNAEILTERAAARLMQALQLGKMLVKGVQHSD